MFALGWGLSLRSVAALKSYLRTGVILIVEKIQKRIGFLGEVSFFLSICLT